MLNAKACAALKTWREMAEEAARQQFLMQGALNRMLHRQMSMAWEKWQQVYADLKFANRMGGGAIRRMLNRKLSMAWEKWQFTVCVPRPVLRKKSYLRGFQKSRLPIFAPI